MAKEGQISKEDQELWDVIAEAKGNGTLEKLISWQQALEAQNAPVPDPICDRMGCYNEPTLTCHWCGANYCEDHPPANQPLDTCDGCGFDLSPDNPFANPVEQAEAASMVEWKREAEEKAAREKKKEELREQLRKEREAKKTKKKDSK